MVSLQSEANHVNSFMKSLERSQFRKVRVFREGEDEGFDNKGEMRSDKSVSCPMVNVSRVGKDDR